MGEDLTKAVVTERFIGQHGERRILVIDTSDPMISVARIVGDIAALVSDLLQIMSANDARFILVHIIDMCSIRVCNFGDLTDSFRSRVSIWRWAAQVGRGMAVGVLN